MSNLKLVLKYKWYDMIEARIKKQEYREIKVSMISLLFDWKKSGHTREEFVHELLTDYGNFEPWLWLKEHYNIEFYRGYSKNRKTMEINYDSIDIGTGNPDWGAEPGKKYFVLELGSLISK